MRHRMSADLKILAQISDLRQRKQILLRELLILRCDVKRRLESVLFEHSCQPHITPVTVVPTGCEYNCLHSGPPLAYFSLPVMHAAAPAVTAVQWLCRPCLMALTGAK